MPTGTVATAVKVMCKYCGTVFGCHFNPHSQLHEQTLISQLQCYSISKVLATIYFK